MRANVRLSRISVCVANYRVVLRQPKRHWPGSFQAEAAFKMIAGGVLERAGDGEQGRFIVKPAGQNNRSRKVAAVAVAEAHRENHAGVARQIRDRQVLA